MTTQQVKTQHMKRPYGGGRRGGEGRAEGSEPSASEREAARPVRVRALRTPRKLALPLVAALTLASLTVAGGAPAVADTTGDQCTFGGKSYAGRPWSLQRVQLDQLWQSTKGQGVKVAVIDTGVDVKNKQLKDAVDVGAGKNLLPPKSKLKKSKYQAPAPRGNEHGTTDTVGHGTKVAGIIAARSAKGTGFVGLAPAAKIIPIKQNDENGSGTADTLAQSIDYAVKAKAKVINISQDTTEPLSSSSALYTSVEKAVGAGVVVVASAGNDGLGGKVKETYPASYPGVLAVAASDRNNERAPFSQSGNFVKVAAPGVDMISTVPKGGHCADNGTSFSAPYVAGVAALLAAKHPDWTEQNIIAQIEQTAERSTGGHDRLVGWGVVDPVAALTQDDERITEPHPQGGVTKADPPTPAKFTLGETPQERQARIGTYAVVGGGVLVLVIAGGALVYRDRRRRFERFATAGGGRGGEDGGKADSGAGVGSSPFG